MTSSGGRNAGKVDTTPEETNKDKRKKRRQNEPITTISLSPELRAAEEKQQKTRLERR